MNTTILDERELLKREKEYVQQLKGGKHPENKLFGLAISGGGIRSASFAMGVLQALHNKKLIEKLDYLSTVSGGGYIGSCLSWFLNKIYHSEDPNQSYSLGEKGKGVRSSEKNVVLSYLRQHGKYLTPGHGLDIISFLGVVSRSMFLGFFTYFPLLTAVIHAMKKGHLFEPVTGFFPKGSWLWPMSVPYSPNTFIVIAILMLLFLAGIAIIYSLGTIPFGGDRFRPYKLRTKVQKMAGWILKITVILLVVGTIPKVVFLLGATASALTSGSISILGVLGAVFQLQSGQNPAKKKSAGASSIVPVIGSLLLIYGLLLGSYLVAESISPLLLLGTVVSAIVVGYLVNLNYVSLHRVYRDRLMEMFLPDMEAITSGKWNLAKEANAKTLDKFLIHPEAASKKRYLGPFHIINTNLIQIDARKAKFRSRGGDNFILSPLFCGSNATGWCPSSHFNGGTMTLASAMAISGAAVNPHAGANGQGATCNWLVSFLMSFLNLRLGYWAKNPKKNKIEKKHTPANYFCPGFLKGLLGTGFNEDANFIELSDGGHFENLALYELIRRRVKTIIISDAGADLDFNFSDLANIVEKVRVDFGVEIDFSKTNKPISDLLPGSADQKSLYKEKYNLAKSGYAIGVIKYPEDPGSKTPAVAGEIYYIKTTLTGALPEDIYGYKSGNPTFPDQSTADQFFDEAQFEAYRELGYQLTKKMLDENKKLTKIS